MWLPMWARGDLYVFRWSTTPAQCTILITQCFEYWCRSYSGVMEVPVVDIPVALFLDHCTPGAESRPKFFWGAVKDLVRVARFWFAHHAWVCTFRQLGLLLRPDPTMGLPYVFAIFP
jgi:hypothetical protein